MGEVKKSAIVIIVGLVLIFVLVGAIILFLLLIDKFNQPNYESHLDTDELHRLVQDPLPDDIKPLHYLVDLDLTSKWHSKEDENHFEGKTKIIIQVGKRSTKYIALDSRGLNVYDVKLFNYTGEKVPTYTTAKPNNLDPKNDLNEIPLNRWFLYPPTSRVVMEMTQHLHQDSLVLLEMSFLGEILTSKKAEESGLRKIPIADEFVLASSGMVKSGGRQTRRIFPCFDDTKFLSLFSLTVRHNSSFNVISNTEQESKHMSSDTPLTIFKTTPPQPTSHFVLLVVPGDASFTDGDYKYGVIVLKGASHNKADLDGVVGRMRKDYKEVLEGSSQKFVVFPKNVQEPEIVSKGLMSISDPVSEDKIRAAWLGSILRLKEANDSWLEEGFKNDVIKEDHDLLAEDFAYRALDWNNLDVQEKDKHFITNKAQSVLKFLDKSPFENNFMITMKKLLKRRTEEDEKEEALLKDLQTKLAWYDKNEDEQRNELLKKWQSKKEMKFNSTTFEEFASELEKESPGSKQMLTTWMRSADYPLLTVEFLDASKSMKVKQSGFHHPHSNYTWEFPLEIWNPKGIRLGSINKSETIINDVDSKDNIIVNPFRKVYGRVNYDKEHWKRLFQHFNVLSKDMQAILINDLFSLAWMGHLHYDVVFNSLDQLRSDKHWIAGEVIEEKIRQIDFFVKDSDLWPAWEKFVEQLTGHLYEKSKEKPIKGLTKIACMHRNIECLRDAGDLHHHGNSSLLYDEDLKEFSLYYYGDGNHFKVGSIPLKAALVARSPNVDDLTRYLKEVAEGKFEKESFIHLFEETTKYFKQQRTIWQWFRNNIRELQKIFSRDEVTTIFEDSVKNFHTTTNIDDARHVWRAGGIHVDEISHNRIQQKMNTNYLWVERNHRNIKEWLDKHGHKN